ncbi:CPBP family intramembrane glutamic endopeptidase [Saccharothrix deserti]|uniref:CPBP family intramembrane glutamic endopeptidase n=1 Tax=Saccharothrix deserti TaxID=2593674 RepID=UPI001EE44966|nr:CPBP family intramembrane glutamic endopeptidase [Saccharothrix deserti]
MSDEQNEPVPLDDRAPAPWPSVDAPARERRAGLTLVAVFLAAQLVMVAASVVVLLAFGTGDPALLEDGLLLALLVVPTSVGAVVAVLGVARLGSGPKAGRARRELAVRWNGRDIGIGVAFGLGGLVLTLPAAALWAAWVGDEQATSAVGDVFAGRELGPVAAAVTFLVVWLVAPLGEEVLFRGVLWRALEHWRWNRWVVFAVTSLAFSFAHLELLRTPLLLVLSIPIGLARLFTGNLLASVVAHQVNNFLPAVALLLATTGALP